MFFIYSLVLTILAVVFLPIILIAFVVQPKFRAGFWQKIGFYNLNLPKEKTVWIHAVSVGEVNAVEGFVKEARKQFSNCNIVLSTVTRTGQAVANSKLKEYTDQIIYFPYDFVFSINSALNAINPDLVIIAETEIWPNFTNETTKRNIPITIINGRISPNSHKGYKKISFFFSKILAKYSLILMQTEGDAQRIVDIGAPQDITKVMGNLKFDITNKLTEEETSSLQDTLKSKDYKVLIAGSTHSGEDEVVLDAYKKLKEQHSNLKLLLAPRHPERNKQVFELIKEVTSRCGLRSEKDNFEEKDIIVLDTMGELGQLYSICDVAFLGGSFSNTGGHNPLEASIYNKPTVSGPTVFNFKDIYRFLTEAGASIVVEDQENLYNKIEELLSDSQIYKTTSDACKQVFEKNSGALEYSIKELKELI